jgi:hypothetical protein
MKLTKTETCIKKNSPFCFSETCDRCKDPFKHQLTKLYLEFLNAQLMPKLNKKTIEYAEWWIFKPESTLAKFIQNNQLDLNLYFRPSELIALIEHIANKENRYDRGNYNIMFLPEELKQCFNVSTVYLPELYNHCLPHVNFVNDSKSFFLKNELIESELYIESPLDIIYTDPSSKFWIPRQLIHPFVSDDNQLIFTWKELCTKFLKLITNPHNSITQTEGNMFFINDDSILAKLFNFKQFHKNQIPDILKKTTKFLGKTNTILSLCSDLKFSHIGPNDPVVYWIEELILKSNNVIPYTPSSIYL